MAEARPLSTLPLHQFVRASTLLVLWVLHGGEYMATEENKELFTKVKQIISEQLGVDEDEVTTTASFVDDLGADSLDQVELVMALEEKFEIEIPDDDAEKLRTVQDAIDYIEKHVKAISKKSA